ncbi:MAG: hypothetical protein J6D46_01170 [Lachnospiraceae bacterium]|nr:hypothetical protein [Lachnospiraceae bacterium]
MIRTLGVKEEQYEEILRGLTAAPDFIDLECETGKTCGGEIVIRCSEDFRLKGYITTDEARIVPEKGRFAGAPFRLVFGVDTAGLQDGDSVTGNICVETNGGAVSIPVRVRIRDMIARSSFGSIETVEDFGTLARENYEEALRLFRSPAFRRILTGRDRRYMALYRGLSKNPVTYSRMEEFLIASGIKDPVILTADTSERRLFDLRESVQENITIHRSGWGGIEITAEAEGDFIELPRRKLYVDDFVGSICEFGFVIRKERLGSGRNYGRVMLSAYNFSAEIPVVASAHGELGVDMTLISQKNRIRLTSLYLDYVMDRINVKTFYSETKKLLAFIRESGNQSIGCALYEAYVEELGGNRPEARKILQEISRKSFKEESLENRAAFFYLSHITGLLDPAKVDIAVRIREMQQRKQESFLLTWILFRVDPDLLRNPSKKMRYMEKLYASGCRSPLLYMEAIYLIRRDGNNLRRMNSFMRSVLLFAVGAGMISEDMARRAAHLSDNEKSFTGIMYRVLAGAYEYHPLPEVLEAVCKLLMKSMSLGPEYFKWFRLAVEHEIRITRIYEFYIETMPENYQKPLPTSVLRYFAMNNMLSDRKKALLYANIIRNRQADRRTYAIYEPTMRDFAERMLSEGRLDPQYAILYQNFITDVVDSDDGGMIAPFLFTNRIYTDDPRMREVIVVHEEMEGEERWPVRGGEAYIRRYTGRAAILFSDWLDNRYASGIAFSEEPLLSGGGLADACIRHHVTFPGLILHACVDDEGNVLTGGGKDRLLGEASVSDAFTEEFRKNVRRTRLAELMSEGDQEAVERFVAGIPVDSLAGSDRVMVIEAMIRCGLMGKAFEVIRTLGAEGVDPRLLVRLVEHEIAEQDFLENEDLLLLCAAVFRQGKFGEHMLEYLAEYFSGNLNEMLLVRESAADFFVDTKGIEERILARATFTGRLLPEKSDILANYREHGGNRRVVRGYLLMESDRCFRARAKISDYSAAFIEKSIRTGEKTDLIMKLALLLYYSKKEKLGIREEEMIEPLLAECASKNLRFAFFRDLPAGLTALYEIEDRVFIEQDADPNAAVTLYYRMSSDGEAFRSTPMTQIYQGIFSREFVLFYGESMEYYIVTEEDGEEKRTEVRVSSARSVDMHGRSRYQLINQMLAAMAADDTETQREKIREYRRAEQVVDAVFELEEEF